MVIESTWSLVSVIFQHVPHFCFLYTLYSLVLQDALGSSSILYVLGLKSAIFLRVPSSFYWRMVYRSHNLCARCAHFYWCKSHHFNKINLSDLFDTETFPSSSPNRNFHYFLLVCSFFHSSCHLQKCNRIYLYILNSFLSVFSCPYILSFMRARFFFCFDHYCSSSI